MIRFTVEGYEGGFRVFDTVSCVYVGKVRSTFAAAQRRANELNARVLAP